jgi:hypothetical protein
MFNRKSYFAFVCLMVSLTSVTLAQNQVLTDWNERASAVMTAEKVNSNAYVTRTMAMTSVAMFEAINAIERRYQPYVINETAPTGVSSEVAAIAAAYTVLLHLYPRQADMLEEAKRITLAKATGDKAGGWAWGENVARQVIALRASDGVYVPNTWRPVTSPGVYVTTELAATPHLGQAKAWLLKSNDQFRPGPPLAIDSEQFAREYNETREMGAVNSSKRSADQTQAALFWQIPGILGWNQATTQLAAQKTMSLVEYAQLLAILNMALADASIAVWDAKYHYNFWRPITAIRNGDLTRNPGTARDAGWMPLINAPLHPEYPAAHSIHDGVGVAILESYFGNGKFPTFTIRYDQMPGVTRNFNSIRQLAEEVSNSRIWGGVHFRTACQTGEAMGKKIGEFAMANYLKPIQR